MWVKTFVEVTIAHSVSEIIHRKTVVCPFLGSVVFYYYFISLAQDSNSFPLYSKSFPQDIKSLPQDTKSFPQVSKSLPQDTKSFSQISKSLAKDTKMFHEIASCSHELLSQALMPMLWSPGRDIELFHYIFLSCYQKLISCYHKILSHSHKLASH